MTGGQVPCHALTVECDKEPVPLSYIYEFYTIASSLLRLTISSTSPTSFAISGFES